MSYIKPNFRHPRLPTNALGYTVADYDGSISTLCAGCGHDSISAAIRNACFLSSIPPHRIAKVSGIGCSSKMPTYFLGKSHGFNSVHGRMPSVATGASLANRSLTYIGVSGDGDTASIGMGQFIHLVRRNVNMTYIVANNGCYGLTKGQDSATADEGSISKYGDVNAFEGIDLASLALLQGASFVARSFSGDKEQLEPLIRAAMGHNGFAFIDVISPCVTFNNHVGSTKSYAATRDHLDVMPLDFVPMREEIRTQYSEGTSKSVTLHDGSVIYLHKAETGFATDDRTGSLNAIQKAKEEGRILTGLLYLDPDTQDLNHNLDIASRPLNELGKDELCPGSKVLNSINEGLR
ncbi:MAG: 2-oxoacid:ferredoxin oxidoreductase subunit beta [Roseibium sp.]|uniref:2-oxoacid:ferredoxin oxidoreductase subunit beta n=1 Tax=Roseibium sp. TaxID=1936156 RepID=UPI001B004B0A|nr:2-oxoacid:ferredoxin oxidoreductase subunit beta [Roseibium sp.]MBO6511549.1 2-oxoacid:ferredoxin oxidoreductase subunit beta [Roseibium sp.]MBO6892682.1 2-oxoacid:ferredoxin oxidoreductase subunit beta [Roseibium sp.]MBO6928921.1 2-oxoacid:ferredoxin oxidoreductase subunit beta [Roseibium sp.]